MKLLIYIFLISLSYVLSDIIDDDAAKKIVVKSFPKKVKPGLYQINNSGKYFKPKTIPTKKPRDENDYTVFPKVNNEQSDVPDSPYFQIEKLPEPKPRVKKVLPEYTWHSRNKRSVNPKKDDGNKKKALRQSDKTILKPVPKSVGAMKGNATNNMKAKKPTKRLNRNIKRQRRRGKRFGKRSQHGRLRSGPNKGRRLKYNRFQNSKHRFAKLRSKFGDKQARKILKDRRNFINMTKPKKGK